MYFGQYANYDPTKTSTYNFYGLNRTRRTSKGEFSDMMNMSTHEYPCAVPRKPRSYAASKPEVDEAIDVVIAPDSTNVENISGFTGICGGGFYYNGVRKSKKFTLSPEWSWQIEQKGNLYIINGYDKTNTKSLIYYYCIDTNEFEEGGAVMRDLIVTSGADYLETIYTTKYGVNGYSITTPDGEVIENKKFCDEYLCEYYTGIGYTMNKDVNIFSQLFKVGDQVTIEGFCGSNNNGQLWNIQDQKIVAQPNLDALRNNTIDTDNMAETKSLSEYDICTVTIKGFSIISKEVGYAHRVKFEVLNKNGQPVTMKNLASNNYGAVYCSGVTLKRRTRVLDNITLHNGVIWGSAPSGNIIYSSKPNDIFCFAPEEAVRGNVAMLVSDTPGLVTGMCEYGNDLLVFKESSITVISGDTPSNYYAYPIQGIGCIDPKSIAVTPSGVLFLSYNGFYIYSGNVPQLFSARLNTKYISAVAGYNDSIYYACAVRADNGKRELLTYNLQYNVWHILDDIDASGFFAFRGKWYIADKTKIYECDSSNEITETVDWSFTSVKIHDNTLDEKGLTELWIRCEMEDGAEFKVETKADDEKFKTHGTYTGAGRQIFRCPIRMNMCDNYQYRISGHGNVVFYEIETHKAFGGRDYKNSAGVRADAEKNTENKFLTY